MGIGGGPPLPVEDWLDVRRCVGMGGGALLGDFVGGGAGAASFAMRAAMAEALPDDFGVFAAAFSFLAASSLAFALAIISATPIFGCARRRSECTPFLRSGVDGAARQSDSTGPHPGPRVLPEAICGPLNCKLGRAWLELA